MKNILMVTLVGVMMATGANALTLKKGEVISPDGSVQKASETVSGQRALEKDGYVIGGGVLFLEGGVEIPIVELINKSYKEIMKVVEDAVISKAVSEHIAKLIAEDTAKEVTKEVVKQVRSEVVKKFIEENPEVYQEIKKATETVYVNKGKLRGVKNFKTRDAAKAARDELRAQGFRAWINSPKGKDGNDHRVGFEPKKK